MQKPKTYRYIQLAAILWLVKGGFRFIGTWFNYLYYPEEFSEPFSLTIWKYIILYVLPFWYVLLWGKRYREETPFTYYHFPEEGGFIELDEEIPDAKEVEREPNEPTETTETIEIDQEGGRSRATTENI